ncbi:MAG: ABC-2 family transporter protein [Deltaproteobacteria bacterium]|nr:ABC-2 family transporter protein [Deltaproteobacteria bacterium]MCW5803963.1 ABC-2 family transporter protein [Deltaproteobacteria bacterium]
MVRYLRLVLVQLRISAAAGMAYRADFIIEGVMAVAWMALTLLPLLVLYDQRSAVAGWDRSSALVVIAYFLGVRAVLEGVVSPSLVDLVERIRSGAFDYVLLKPVDAQALISASRFEPWKIFDLLGALALVIYAFHARGGPPSATGLAVGALLFVNGVLAMYAVWILCAAAAFWVVRLDNLTYLLGAIFDVARWPIHVFRGLWRMVFTFVIPVAVMTTFPAMALLDDLDARTAIATLAGTAALLVVSRLVWRTAIRSYTSASS